MERVDKGKPAAEKRISRRSFIKRVIGLSGDGGEASLLDTAKLSVAFWVGIVATGPVLLQIEEYTNIKTRNTKLTETVFRLVREDPLGTFFLGSFVGPVAEEVAFRIMPSFALSQLSKEGDMWRVGIPSSLIFASLHSLEGDENGQISGFNSVPIQESGVGMFLWKLARQRGYLHPLLAHSILNSMSLTLGFILPDSLLQQDPAITR